MKGFILTMSGLIIVSFWNHSDLPRGLLQTLEYMRFIEDGGYSNPELWLSEGWGWVEKEEWDSPLYWERQDGKWHVMTMYGLEPVNPGEPVCHVSYYEADAYARWSDARLPTEAEWETASLSGGPNGEPLPVEGNFAENRIFHPATTTSQEGGLSQMYGDVWEWTQSHYSPYPGYAPLPGTLGEYNGKFMANQFVLRGGSCATPVSHIRSTYRNFFHPDSVWQFSGNSFGKNRP